MLLEQLVDVMLHARNFGKKPPNNEDWGLIFKRLRELEDSPKDTTEEQESDDLNHKAA